MKSMNTLAVAAVLALTGVSLASATPTVIRVSGSTAFRAAVVTAEVNFLSPKSGVYGIVYGTGASAPALTSANQSVLESGDSTYLFENNFTGSIAGVQNVNGIGSLQFPTGGGTSFVNSGSTYQITNLGNGSSSSPATGGGWAGNAAFTTFTVETKAPDVVFSDVSSTTASTVIQSYVPGQSGFVDGSTEASAVVGIVPFVFIANQSSDISTFSNSVSVTPQAFNNLWSSGTVKASIFTGNSADNTVNVYALGRDIDSGTRTTSLAETGYGLAGSGAAAAVNSVTQYYPFDSTTANTGTTTQVVGITSDSLPTIQKLALVPASTVDGAPLSTGNGGYASGGNLATAMSSKFTGLTKTALVTYLGLSDAKNAIIASGSNRQTPVLLSYNGSFLNLQTTGLLLAADQAKIEYGSYTFWTYEHEFYANNNGLGLSVVSAVANSLQTLLSNSGVSSLDQISSGGVTFSAMKVARNDDGLAVQ